MALFQNIQAGIEAIRAISVIVLTGSLRRRGDPAAFAVADLLVRRSLADEFETRLTFAVMHQPAPFQFTLILPGIRRSGPPGFFAEDLAHDVLRLMAIVEL